MLFDLLHAKLGVMTWPLLLCSVFGLVLLLQRALALMVHFWPGRHGWLKHLPLHDAGTLKTSVAQRRGLAAEGIALLLKHQSASKDDREALLSLWLTAARRRANTNLRLLTAVGVIAPLLGLLGTVIGLITMFETLANSGGPATPAMLAEGLGLAMGTTAAGLAIALPAIASAHLLGVLTDHQFGAVEHILNHCHLQMDSAELPQSEPRPRLTRVAAS
ncbi:MotA/TolQ/ExbB proton channel [Ferrimonas balearica DSM 9799]|uniref:MotA/TolQ/ExbB proton channel n=1 Tax=Ferrimonas balearica (strain DSM 9799 / CCM 4581 / KCTC 23876 / PAT) TaxID=550540 RepID=E1SL62_FERBD|nr:MotA/TolQ/ExbB proton channel family protein [Ferrimonas balearica]ADN75440.1 MotA/TolQ/ExbB proton channel [Ferrimonas balearica DSM 9799]